MDRGDRPVLTVRSSFLQPGRHGLMRRLAVHAWRSMPPRGITLAGTIVWAAVMAANATLGVWLRDWETSSKIQSVAILFAIGGALGFPVGLFLARFFGMGKRPETAFAAAFLGFSIATIGITAAIYALIYRSYYAAWHAEAFTLTWFFQQAFTSLGALAQFAVLGLRLYFPLGFAALFIVSFWFARKPR